MRVGVSPHGSPPSSSLTGIPLISSDTIDAAACQLRVEVSDEELALRRRAWVAPPAKATSGVLAKYVRLVKSASEGCVTD